MFEILHLRPPSHIESQRPLQIDEELIEPLLQNVVDRVNRARPNSEGQDGDLRRGFCYLSGLPEDSLGDFAVRENSEILNDGFDAVNPQGKIAFSLGIGEESLMFLSKNTPEKGYWIYKSMPLEDIKNGEQLKEILEGFVLLEPLSGEVIDVRRETLTALMMDSERRKEGKASKLIDTLKAGNSSKHK